MERSEKGANLIEFSLIVLLVAMIAVGSITPLKDRMEAYLWLVTLFIESPETRSDSGVTIDVWAPRSAFRIFGNIDAPGPWCRVVLTTNSWDKRPEPLVQQGDIQGCASSPP